MTSTPIFQPNGWTNHSAAVAALRAQPGVWLLVGVKGAQYNARNLASNIRRGRLAYEPAGAYEASTVLLDDETGVYARYIGGDGGETR